MPGSTVDAVNPFTNSKAADPFKNPDRNDREPGSVFLDPGRRAGVFLNDVYAEARWRDLLAAEFSIIPTRADLIRWNTPLPQERSDGPQLRAADPLEAAKSSTRVFAPMQDEIFRATIRGPVLGAAAPSISLALGAAAITEGTLDLAAGVDQGAISAFGTALEVLPYVSPRYLLTSNQQMTMAIRESQAVLQREWLHASLAEQRSAHTIQASVAFLAKDSLKKAWTPPSIRSIPNVTYRYTPAMASDPVAANTTRFLIEWMQEGGQPMFRGVRRVTDDMWRRLARDDLIAQGIDLTDRDAMHLFDAAIDPLPYLEGDRRTVYMFGLSRTNQSFGGQLAWQLRRYGIRPGDAFHISFTGFPTYEAVPPSFQSMPMWFQPLP
jgi:hypothetical protein